MTGAIIENMSTRKLSYVCGSACVALLFFSILTAIYSPSPNASMQYLATKCVDKSGGKDTKSWFWPRGKGSCQKIDRFDDPEASKQQLTADHIVFAFQLPHPRDNVQIDFSRWQQTLMSVLSMDIEYGKIVLFLASDHFETIFCS